MPRATGKLVTRSVMEELRAELKKKAAMPPPPSEKYSRVQLARELDHEIEEMKKAGYAMSQIAAIFKEKGVDIHIATLRARKRPETKDKSGRGIERAKERIVATETASKDTAKPSGRFAVRPDSAEL